MKIRVEFLPYIQIIFPQTPIKRGWRDAEQFGGFAAVPAGFFERADYLLAFVVAEVCRGGVMKRADALGTRGAVADGNAKDHQSHQSQLWVS